MEDVMDEEAGEADRVSNPHSSSSKSKANSITCLGRLVYQPANWR